MFLNLGYIGYVHIYVYVCVCKSFCLLLGTLKVVPQKMAAAQITHSRAHTHEIRMF